ncbi:protein-tyrosine phosphatase family protein [Pseudooceanicola algae]|uniref:Tyrosine specific protein phosphatases domain-containing protein n=1 Tax=Pseudooceanicola algae TaxID=1537215 RepID=A0A418SH06_9RHOB|nr:hypothetical protein [Pseudooceanicola algae]QPM91801.1 hypothetical protein PSAL_030560 [Pseudooceanicola algae]
MPEEVARALSIRGILPVPDGGSCLLAGFPGLATTVQGAGYIDAGIRAAVLDHLGGAPLWIALPETGELPEGALDQLGAALDRRGAELLHLPIPDFKAPDGDFMIRWAGLRDGLHDRLDQGGRLGITCQYGAGRSGLLACLLLIERGFAPEIALQMTRSAIPEAVESDVQQDWLMDRRDATLPRYGGTASDR